MSLLPTNDPTTPAVAASPKLSMSEILFLLKSKATPGQAIPASLNAPPWRVPGAAPCADAVNAVLDASMEAQSATVPGSGDFEEFVLSNASLSVAAILRYAGLMLYT